VLYIISEIPAVASEHYSTKFMGHRQMPGANTRSTVVVLLLQDYNADGRLRSGSISNRWYPGCPSCTLRSVPIS
jgi:hypothetical protein